MTPSVASGGIVIVGWLLAAGGPGVSVVDEAADRKCPERADVEAALERRLGDAAAPEGAWTVRYRGAADDSVTMSLEDDTGRTHVERRIDLGGAACSTAADAISIIVERYFGEIGWTRGTPLPAPAAAPPPPPGVAPPKIAQATPPVAGPEAAEPSHAASATRRGPARTTSSPSIPLGAEMGLSGVVLYGTGASNGVKLLLGVGLGFRVGPVIGSALVLLPEIDRSEAVALGQVRARSTPVAGSLRWHGDESGRVRRLGFDALIRSETGEGVSLAGARSGDRSFLSLGIGGSYGFRGRNGSAALDASFLVTPWAGHFVVGGIGPVLEPPILQLLVGLRLAVAGP